VRRIDDIAQIKHLRLAEIVNELPRQMCVRLVGDRRHEVSDVGIDGVAEEQHLHDWNADDHCKCQPVAF